ncbi:ribonucleoside-diphosphate reductase subunit alpha [Chitinivibrio alkaliphilus]|uniref:Ribonucleoside-diphosphate reductase n=1 Tax=Chitinivibrio alkaliphilus ACht1 TaxID=1313304 RepID=U7D2Y2_9BACT|nr:ribonucleoside-diphosphate reductase subunit alpha [Chitinivibrio alkaliphilus]ERP30834.1 ribonucleoside-diphosphate reductase subunit alpha [Chitinivibrio alkaliphilus ACht1]
MQIIKRDQRETSVDIQEIRKALEWACAGLDVSYLELESHSTALYGGQDRVSTRDIQLSLVDEALHMTTPQRPEFRIVAARLLLMEIYKEAAYNRGYTEFGYGDYLTCVREAVRRNLYDPVIFEYYTEAELYEAGKFLTPAYDLDFDYAGARLLINRYLIRDREEVFELPQEMFLTIALFCAANEEKTHRLDRVREFYEVLAARKISLATPILLNLRRCGGNLSSCFVAAADDSLDSIFYTVNTIARISKNGGGVGVNISRIRSAGAEIKGTPGASGGVVPWIRIMNDTAVAVNQMGKRAGALTVALDAWHHDLPEFLELQTENGDQRKKAYDIFPQVVVPDLFMERVEERGEWTLFDPHEVRLAYGVEIAELWGDEFKKWYTKLESDTSLSLTRRVSARELFKQIMKSQVETGMPYLFFKDTVNRMNPNKHDGIIPSGNLCQESFSNFRPSAIEEPHTEEGSIRQISREGLVHTCNLVSLNLAEIDEYELPQICARAVRILDNSIDMTFPPIMESRHHNERYRTIGVGAMGLADLLAKKKIPFEKAAAFADAYFEKIAYFTVSASADLALERGAYPAFAGSDWERGIFFGRDRAWYEANSDIASKWLELMDKISREGIRNSQLLAIAPNTSSSLLQGCTAGVLPVFSKFHIDKNANGAIPLCPPFIKESFWYYKENKHIDQREVVRLMGAIQKWIDQGISMELLYNLNTPITARDIYEVLMTAWKEGVKTVYYTRTLQKNSNISEKAECESCAN